MGHNQGQRCLEEFARWQYQLDVRQLQRLVKFVKINRVKSDIYDCHVPFVSLPSDCFRK